MVSDTGNVNKNSQDQLEQNERNGYFYLEVQEEPFRQGLLFTPWEMSGSELLAWDSWIVDWGIISKSLTRALGRSRIGYWLYLLVSSVVFRGTPNLFGPPFASAREGGRNMDIKPLTGLVHGRLCRRYFPLSCPVLASPMGIGSTEPFSLPRNRFIHGQGHALASCLSLSLNSSRIKCKLIWQGRFYYALKFFRTISYTSLFVLCPPIILEYSPLFRATCDFSFLSLCSCRSLCLDLSVPFPSSPREIPPTLQATVLRPFPKETLHDASCGLNCFHLRNPTALSWHLTFIYWFWWELIMVHRLVSFTVLKPLNILEPGNETWWESGADKAAWRCFQRSMKLTTRLRALSFPSITLEPLKRGTVYSEGNNGSELESGRVEYPGTLLSWHTVSPKDIHETAALQSLVCAGEGQFPGYLYFTSKIWWDNKVYTRSLVPELMHSCLPPPPYLFRLDSWPHFPSALEP